MNKLRKSLQIGGVMAGAMMPVSAAVANTNNAVSTPEGPAHQTAPNKSRQRYNAEPSIQKLARKMVTSAIVNVKAGNLRTTHIDLPDNTFADESVTYDIDTDGQTNLSKPVALDIYVAKNDVVKQTTAQLPIVELSFDRTKAGKWSSSVESTDPTTPNSYYRLSEIGQQVIEIAQGNLAASSPTHSVGIALQEERSPVKATKLLQENLTSAYSLIDTLSQGQVPAPGDYMPQ
jgi:hypothetical protein